jgi:hypothetical protein
MYANNVREISDAFKKWSVGKEVQSPASPKMEIESKVEEPISAKEPEPEVTAEEETVAQPEAVTPTVTLLDGDDMFAGMFS